MQLRCSCGVIREIKVIDPSIGEAELFLSVNDLGDGGIMFPQSRSSGTSTRLGATIGLATVELTVFEPDPGLAVGVSPNPSRLGARALILASFVVQKGKPLIDALGRISIALPRERRSAGNYVVSVQRCRHRPRNCPICD
jgi:hypothetical protein